MSNHTIKGNTGPFTGSISVPGDKSISHRAVMISSIAQGRSCVKGLLRSGDVFSTINAFRAMGIELEQKGTDFYINGRGMHGLREPLQEIDAGNSGTTARILAGLLSAQRFDSVITGDKYLKKRPMKRVVDPLRQMGAEITGEDGGDRLPLHIHGTELNGIRYTLPVASAQVKSCLILAGLYANGITIITEPERSRDHTERMLDHFGVKLVVNDNTIEISKPEQFQSRELSVPSDISSAAFFIVGALINRGSEIIIENVGINPARTGIIDILRSMNASIEIINERNQCGEPVGDLLVKYSELKGTEIKGDIIPRTIDELPVVAVAACFADGETIISEAGELRVKETDRISAMTAELKKFGADIKELEDGMVIRGTDNLKGASCNSWGDHRIAMSLSVVATRAEGYSEIHDSEVIAISFPDFFQILEKARK